MKFNRRKFLQLTSFSTFLSYFGLRDLFGATGVPVKDVQFVDKERILNTAAKAKLTTGDSEPTLVRWLVRPQDQLHIRLEFFNLKLDSTKNVLVRASSATAYIAFDFGPQHVLERVFIEGPDPFPPPITSMLSGTSRLVFKVPKSLTSIPFQMDTLLNWESLEPNLVPVPVTAKRKWKPRSPVNTESFIEAPTGLFLSPQVGAGGWLHRRSADGRNSSGNGSHNRFELWHTRHIGRPASSSGAPITNPWIRAVWSTAMREGNSMDRCAVETKDAPSYWPLNESIQEQIVRLTSDPEADTSLVEARNLMLTSLGAWLDLKGDWKDQADFNLIQWIHRATMGRDHFVKVVERGYLLPFGHKATQITISERKIGDAKEEGAYLRQIKFIVVREPIKRFSNPDDSSRFDKYTVKIDKSESSRTFLPVTNSKDETHINTLAPVENIDIARIRGSGTTAGAESSAGSEGAKLAPIRLAPIEPGGRTAHFEKASRSIPFTSVELKTLITPPMVLDKSWVVVDGVDFQFMLDAVDWDGKPCTSSIAMQFILATDLEKPSATDNDCAPSSKSNEDTSSIFPKWLAGSNESSLKSPSSNKISSIVAGYDSSSERRRTMYIEGQSVCFAPPVSSEGQTIKPIHDTHEIRFRIRSIDQSLMKEMEAMVYPILDEASVENMAVARMSGQRNVTIGFHYYEKYLDSGFSVTENVGTLYGELVKNAKGMLPEIKFQSSKEIGGIVVPDMTINGLSVMHGVVAGSKDKFNEIAKGVITSSDFFKDFFDKSAKLFGGIKLNEIIGLDYKNLPALVTKTTYDKDGLPEAIEVTLDWKSSLKEFEVFKPEKDCYLEIRAVSRFPLKIDEKPSSSIVGELKNFRLVLLKPFVEFLEVGFKSFTFRSINGQKPDIDVVLSDKKPIQFVGPLKCLEALQDYIPIDGFSDPPRVNVTRDGIDIGYDMQLPDVSAGAWGFANIKFGAGLRLPFNGDPMLASFAFADPQDTFRLTYSGLSGGGYFGIDARMGGVEKIIGAFEVGANLSFDFGVAKGFGYLKVGVNFVLNEQEGKSGANITGYVKTGGSVLAFSVAMISLDAQMMLSYDGKTGKTSASGHIRIAVDNPIYDLSAEIPWNYTLSGESTSTAFNSQPDTTRHAAAGVYTEDYFSAFA